MKKVNPIYYRTYCLYSDCSFIPLNCEIRLGTTIDFFTERHQRYTVCTGIVVISFISDKLAIKRLLSEFRIQNRMIWRLSIVMSVLTTFGRLRNSHYLGENATVRFKFRLVTLVY